MKWERNKCLLTFPGRHWAVLVEKTTSNLKILNTVEAITNNITVFILPVIESEVHTVKE